MKKILYLLLVFLMVPYQAVALPGLGDLKSLNPLGGGSDIDFAGSKTELTALFFKSSAYYMEAQATLAEAYGKDALAKSLRSNIEYQNNSKISEADRMKNSIKVTSEASEEIKNLDLQNSNAITAEGKILYAKSLSRY